MKRLSYIACTTILATGFLLAAHLVDLNRQLDREMLEQMDRLLRMLEESENESRELREENQELERLHYVRAEQRAALSRGGRPAPAVMSASGMTAEHFERAFRELDKPGMAGLGQALVDAEAETGVNALILAGICALESGWGRSKLAVERNNLAGLGVYRPGLGMTFESRGACIDYLARLLAGRPGTLTEVGAWYAEDPGWAEKVAGCMKVIGGANHD